MAIWIVRFIHLESTDEQRLLGQSVVEGEFQDTDGVIFSVAINVDKRKSLLAYELDFWKVDFSALQRFPGLANFSGAFGSSWSK